MKVGVGPELTNFPFGDARAFWRWVARCEDSTVHSIWQTERPITEVIPRAHTT